MTVSVGTEKGLDKVKQPFLTKKEMTNKLEIKNFLNLKKEHIHKTTVHIIPNGEKPKARPLRLEIKQECFLSILLINIVLDGVPS